MPRKNYPSDPYRTMARFNSTCSTCGKSIKKGDSIVYDKYRKLVYCLSDNVPACGTELLKSIQAEKSYDQYGTDIY